jgi:hypothetical protein
MGFSTTWQRFLPLILILALACNDDFEDVLPEKFLDLRLQPDVIYMYNGGSPVGVRLDPLVNDSIKVEVTVTYSTPNHGVIRFIPNEGWFYRPADEFIGTDQFNYTVCHQNNCLSSTITMQVEEPLDLNTCTFEMNGESVTTRKDQPVSIAIFHNDQVCPYLGSSLFKPTRGNFTTYSYSGTFKNIYYVYFPPKGFTGTDAFRYRLFTPDGFLEATCTITITD